MADNYRALRNGIFLCPDISCVMETKTNKQNPIASGSAKEAEEGFEELSCPNGKMCKEQPYCETNCARS